MDLPPITPLGKALLHGFEKKEQANTERKISVNPFVSKVASWYEKLRNAMEYREDEVILRSTIERILKRRLLLGGNAKTTAEPLIRELVWARYLEDNAVPLSSVENVEQAIDLYLQFRLEVLRRHKISDAVINEWTYHLLSSAIEGILHPHKEEELVSNFMYQLLKDAVTIVDDTEEAKNAQVYIAIRKAFARDDVAFLRYHMFLQYFGKLTKDNLEHVAQEFLKGYREIVYQLKYPRKEKILAYVKRNTPPFLILEDVLKKQQEEVEQFVENEKEFEKAVFEACERRYQATSAKVQRAIIRSVAFIFLTKLMFAFAVEGTYEKFVYGKVLWSSIALNTGIPPLLMILVSFFIKTPGVENTKRIYAYIQSILHDPRPKIAQLVMKKARDRSKPLLTTVFSVLWVLAFLVSFGVLIYVLSSLHFNLVSQFVFLFFLAIVSFLSYRISLTAHVYKLGDSQGVLTPFVDFLFMPVVQVGRHLTQGISQINILLIIFDLFIETPFKVIFAFFEQWFHFLHSKREELE